MRVLAALTLLAGCATAQTAPAPEPVLSMQELLDRSPASDWRALDPENLIYMDLPAGRVIFELAPHYAPRHAANIRALARAGFFDGASIVRSQDNYVVQWGRDEGEAAPIGDGVLAMADEFARPRAGVAFTPAPDVDSYADETGFSDGFPVARNGELTWMTHCYGMVGAGRGDTADSGSGAELYVVIGQAPRHLDRNVTMVGRVVQGMELLSTMPRGTGPLGFYETPEQRTPIRRVRVGADVPLPERANLEALRTESATFAAVLESRRTRREDWFLEPTGRINLCNAPLPVRVRPSVEVGQ